MEVKIRGQYMKLLMKERLKNFNLKYYLLIALCLAINSLNCNPVYALNSCNEPVTAPVAYSDKKVHPDAGPSGGAGRYNLSVPLKSGLVTIVWDSFSAAVATNERISKCDRKVQLTESNANFTSSNGLADGFWFSLDVIKDTSVYADGLLVPYSGVVDLSDPKYNLSKLDDKSYQNRSGGSGFSVGAISIDPTDNSGEGNSGFFDLFGNKFGLSWNGIHVKSATGDEGSSEFIASDGYINQINIKVGSGSGATYKIDYEEIGCQASGKQPIRRMTKITNSNGEAYIFNYAPNSLMLRSVQFPDGSVQEMCFNQNGIIRWIKDSSNYVTHFDYTKDSVTRTTKAVPYEGGAMTNVSTVEELYYPTSYNGFRLLQRITERDSKNQIASKSDWIYDSLGRVVSYTSFPGETITYRYKDNTTFLSQIWGATRVIDLENHDINGNPQTIKYSLPNGTTRTLLATENVTYNKFAYPLSKTTKMESTGLTESESFQYQDDAILKSYTKNGIKLYSATIIGKRVEQECNAVSQCKVYKYSPETGRLTKVEDEKGNKIVEFSDPDTFGRYRVASYANGVTEKVETGIGGEILSFMSTFGNQSSKITAVPSFTTKGGAKVLSGMEKTRLFNGDAWDKFTCNGDYQGGKCNYNNLKTGVKIDGIS